MSSGRSGVLAEGSCEEQQTSGFGASASRSKQLWLLGLVLPLAASLAFGSAVTVAGAKKPKKAPPGAVKVVPKNLKRLSGPVWCAKSPGKWSGWRAGSKLSKGFFITELQKAKNFSTQARSVSGKAKAKTLKKAAAAKEKHRRFTPKCNRSASQPPSYNPPSYNPPTSPPPPNPGPGSGQAPAQTLKFNTNRAVALATVSDQARSRNTKLDTRVVSSRDTSDSNLDAILPDGEVIDAVSGATSNLRIRDFVISPTGDVYVVFDQRIILETGEPYGWGGYFPPGSNGPQPPAGTPCVLAKVDKESGTPTCVDTDLVNVAYSWGGYDRMTPPAVQFDSSGAVYYMGYKLESTSEGYQQTSVVVNRKSSDGNITALVPSSSRLWMNSFLVTPRGAVILRGWTQSSGTNWTRFVSPGGDLDELSIPDPQYMVKLSDGNIYFGLYYNYSGSGDYYGPSIRRFLDDSLELDSRPWYEGTEWSASPNDPHHSYSDVCTDFTWSEDSYRSGWCSQNHIYAKKQFRTDDGRELLLVNGWTNNGNRGSLVQIFNEEGSRRGVWLPPLPNLRSVDAAVSIGTGVALAGKSANNKYVLSRFDLADTDERGEEVLIDETDQVEIYNLEFLESTNELIFDGLRFRGNKYVMGRLDLDDADPEPDYTELRAGSYWQGIKAFE